jgi:hypothetical protein
VKRTVLGSGCRESTLIAEGIPRPIPGFLALPFGGKEGSFQAVRTGCWNTVRHGLEGPLELSGLSVDACEAKEVAAAHPEVVKKSEACLA